MAGRWLQSGLVIVAYLATIDEMVDDVLRAQRDAVFADVIGVDFVIDEAMTVREHVGRVSAVAWSKGTPMTIARTQRSRCVNSTPSRISGAQGQDPIPTM